MQVSIKTLKNVFRHKNIDIEFLEELQRLLMQYGDTFNIKTKKQLARFLSMCYHEIAFKKNGKPRLRENLNYKAKQLKRFSKIFRNNNQLLIRAMSLKGLEKRKFIAMEWYGKGKKAKVLGNKKPIDGWRYRGFGCFQITGRYNTIKIWQHIRNKLGLEPFNENGEIYDSLLNSYFGAIISAFAFWDLYKMYECRSTKCVTNIINRGLPKKEKKERIQTTIRIYSYLKEE